MIRPPSPYVGARSLARGDLIFGRDRERSELLDLLVAERTVVLHSPPGAGKTSLINAGLAPDLEEAGFLALPAARVQWNPITPDTPQPGNPYTAALVATLGSTLEHPSPGALPGNIESLRSVLDAVAAEQRKKRPAAAEGSAPEDGPSGRPLVLIIDQFEELLTSGPSDSATKRQFLDHLADLLKHHRWWLLLAMREDQLPSLDALLRRSQFHYAARYRLELLGPAEARKAIQDPAQSERVTFTDEAADRLVRDLLPPESASTPDSELPQLGPLIDPMQLQLVCLDLWTSLPDGTCQITLDHLQKRIDVDSTLMGFYDRAVMKVCQASKTNPRMLREWFGRWLITELDTRGTVFRGPEHTGGVSNATVDLLDQENLVRAEPRAGGIWYELPHDRLVKPIRKSNAHFTEEATRSVGRRRERAITIGIVVLAAGAVWLRSQSAEKQSKEQLLSVAESPLAVKDLIVPLLRYKEKRDSAADSELRTALRRPEPTRVLRLAGPAHQGAISADGRFVAAIDSAGALTLWRDGIVVPSDKLAADVKGISALAFSPGGRRLGLGFKDGRVMTLRGRTLESAKHADLGSAEVLAMAYGPEGASLAVATKDDSIHILDGRELIQRMVLTTAGLGDVNALAFSPTDSALLVSVHHNSAVNAWHLPSPEPVHTLRGHTSYVYGVAFHPGGVLFATASKDQTVKIWSTETWKEDTTLRDHSDNVYDVAFSPGGDLLVSAGRDGHVTVWDVNREWHHLGDLLHHGGPVRTARFSRDADTLLTASEDSTLIVWATRGTVCDRCTGEQLVAAVEQRVKWEDSLLKATGVGHEEHFRETGSVGSNEGHNGP